VKTDFRLNVWEPTGPFDVTSVGRKRRNFLGKGGAWGSSKGGFPDLMQKESDSGDSATNYIDHLKEAKTSWSPKSEKKGNGQKDFLG